MNTHSRIHIVAGPVGAGKTTYARQLAEQTNGIVFSIDNWMSSLFKPDLSEDVDLKTMIPAWFAERVDRCESMIYETSKEILATGGVVVLDLGFIRKSRRDKAHDFASSQELQAQLHCVSADKAVRQKRIEQRNLERGPTYAMGVSPAMFEFTEKVFETPTEHELESAIVVRT
ncbi:MAG: AAA family ATPase [Methylobacter sp.]|nr:AAA family ATPase [Methylobacter sp.]